WDSHAAREEQRLAVGQSLQLGQFFEIGFQQISQLPQKAAPFRGQEITPRPALKSLAGGFDGAIDVRLISLGNLAENFASSRIVGCGGLAGSRVPPLAVNQYLSGLAEKFRDLGIKLNRCGGGARCSPTR